MQVIGKDGFQLTRLPRKVEFATHTTGALPASIDELLGSRARRARTQAVATLVPNQCSGEVGVVFPDLMSSLRCVVM